MSNVLYLPELREMLAENDAAALKEFCEALHPARTADFMSALTPEESWAVLQHADPELRAEVFGFFEEEKQKQILECIDRAEAAALIGDLPPDDRVDLLQEVAPEVVQEVMPLVSTEERRDILRLSAYPEHTAGAVMTTEFARLSEEFTVRQALDEIARQAAEQETIYYLYVVDAEDHLRGLISARQLLTHMGRPDTPIRELMERDLVTVRVGEDQEEVARKVARYDLLAIPVVDDEHRLLGIITHDDVIDVVREEAAEDAYLQGAIHPLEKGYLETRLWTLTWKRGVWLTILFFEALLTMFALDAYETVFQAVPWLVLFIPLVISTGGNSGNQSATLIVRALATGGVGMRDWWRIIRRELLTGLVLGVGLGAIGYACAIFTAPDHYTAVVIPVTLVLVVVAGVLTGSLLPLVFRRMGFDPALMSNPFVACLIDFVGILIYMNVAVQLLQNRPGVWGG